MRQVGVKALKNDLSRYLKVVQAGETVQVTDRGRVVAEIGPPRALAISGLDDDQARILAELVAEGAVQPAQVRLTRPLPRSPGEMTFEEVMRDLDESREDRV